MRGRLGGEFRETAVNLFFVICPPNLNSEIGFMARSLKDYFFITLKGAGMGAADVVPGVSGGTIAFITGIYEELLNTIKSFNLQAVKVLTKEGVGAFWKHINGTFLVALFLGIGISVVGLSRVLSFLMERYPVLLWAFFFGLVIASAIFVGKQLKRWDITRVLVLVAGGVGAWFLTSASHFETPDDLWFIFVAGAIAICAMILPGISGSFMLLIMGKYELIINSIKEMDVKTLGVFAAGCIVGLLSFSHVLSWAFRKFHDHTLAILTGFMLGSLNKVWPWKNTLETHIDRHGEIEPWVQVNVLPGDFSGTITDAEKAMGITEKPDYLLFAIGLAVIGFALVFLIEKLGTKKPA